MDSLAQIRKELAEICDKSVNTRLGDLITQCVAIQVDIDRWCRNKAFLLYSLPAIIRVLYENEDLIEGVGDWLNAKSVEVAVLNEIPFMNDQSDLDFLNIIVRLISDKIKEIGPIHFAGLVYIGQSLTIFVGE